MYLGTKLVMYIYISLPPQHATGIKKSKKVKKPQIPAALNRTVLTVKFMVNLRGSPEPLIKLIAHLIRHEGRPTKRARLLIMVHPTVQTRPVKNVLAIRQTPDLLLDLKLVQANGAVFRAVSG